MLRMPSFNAALLALVLSALLVILLAVLIGMLATSGPGLAQAVDPERSGGRESWEVAAAGEERVRAWEAAKESALVGLEGLRAEIHLLEALSVLQSRLLEWNEVRLESGVGLSSLEASLCEADEVRVWCEILPVTFGRGGGGEDERG